MRIAQIAPLYESVPPQLYGGTERVVHDLTEQLVELGHEVTLFASGDSRTSAELIAGSDHSLPLDPECKDQLAHHLVMLEEVVRRAPGFDVIHNHLDYLFFPFSRRVDVPHLSTLHGRLDIPDLKPLYAEYSRQPVVSISDSQRVPLANLNWLGTIYHGMPRDRFTLHTKPSDYLAFVGRVSPEKGLDQAIEIARLAGLPLRIAAKVDTADQAYFRAEIEPLLHPPEIELVGEISDAEKDEFIGQALALLFPINWPEPFGLVMIEAMACGTPVIAYPRGSVGEVMQDGVTGYVVNDATAAANALRDIGSFDRAGCRAVFEARFTARRMADAYVELYQRLLAGSPGGLA